MKIRPDSFFALLVLIALAALVPASLLHASSNSLAYLTGSAWSDNVGWINLGGNGGDVTINSDDTLSGYAWGDNIGWVNFGANSCGATPSIDPVTGEMSGWAQAINGIGADGCISLSCTNNNGCSSSNYQVVLNNSHTYAWGSDTVGWIDFADVQAVYGGEITTAFDPNFVATPARVQTGASVSLSWDASVDMSSCSGVVETPGSPTPIAGSAVTKSSGITVNNIQANTVFTLTCTDSQGAQHTATVSVSLVPVFKEI